MKTTIFYFSGRGNALNAARIIAEKLEDTKLVPVYNALHGKPDLTAERIGFVFPVIDLGMPAIVSKLIRKLDVKDKNKYFFAVVTTGGMPAGTMLQVRNRLKAKGLKLSAGFFLVNNGKQEALDEWDKNTDEIVSIVRDNKENEYDNVKLLDRFILTGLGNKLALLLIPREDRKFIVKEDCNGCGTCEKVCPVKNIIIKNDRPEWLHRCEQCGACFNCCPQKALQGKNLAAHTYHMHPAITIKDMIIE